MTKSDKRALIFAVAIIAVLAAYLVINHIL